MPDYFNVTADYERLMNKHFTRGRNGRSIKYIVRHHNGGRSTTDDTWNTWQTRQASAHYQIEESGRVGQLVNDSDTAWANGNQTVNEESLTIEHSNTAGSDYPMTDATVESGAKWAAALCWFYKLGRPEFGKNIRDHRNFYSTACPYHLAAGGKYHDRYMAIAQAHYDWMSGVGATPVANEIDAEAFLAAAWIGKPTAPEAPCADGVGRWRPYDAGVIYWHPEKNKDAAGIAKAIAVPTNIFQVYTDVQWEQGFLGYPNERHRVVDGVGDTQSFEGGVITRKYGAQGFTVHGAILDRWRGMGDIASAAGWPASNEGPYPDNGRAQQFDNEAMIWHPTGVSRVQK